MTSNSSLIDTHSSSSSSSDTTCGGLIECGGSLSSANCGPLYENSMVNVMDCDVCECVSLPVEYFQDSSSSSASLPFGRFFEIRASSNELFEASSSSSVESVTVLVFDAQLSSEIEVAAFQQRGLSTCYIYASEEQCPDGYFLQSFIDGCVAECDKICCPLPDDGNEPMICGRAYSGSVGYNSPWSFYFEPESIRLAYRRSLDPSVSSNLKPSQIQDLMSLGLSEGSEFCLNITDAVRPMRVVGPEYCYEPLTLRATRAFDEQAGEFVQQTLCEGDCENIAYDYCIDAEIQQFLAQTDARLSEIEEDVEGEPYEKTEQDFFDNIYERLEGIDGDLEYVPSLEEIEQNLISRFFAPSSSSSETPLQFSFDYELQPISILPQSPAAFALEEGPNFILSLVGGAYADTYFSFSIQQGAELVGMYAVVWDYEYGSATLSLQDEIGTIGETAFGIDLDSELFPCASSSSCSSPLPLDSNQYTMKISSSVAEEVEYVLIFVVEQAP